MDAGSSSNQHSTISGDWFLARDVIYTSRAYATMSVSVCLSVMEVHWCIIALRPAAVLLAGGSSRAMLASARSLVFIPTRPFSLRICFFVCFCPYISTVLCRLRLMQSIRKILSKKFEKTGL